MSSANGALIIFEGSGCVGKSSAIDSFKNYLIENGIDHEIIMNHANSPFTQGLRDVLANWGADATEHSKVFVYAAIWNELYIKTVKPALEAGKVVIMDRYIPTTYFFQAPATDVTITSIMSNTLHQIADACVYMTCDYTEVKNRIDKRLSVRNDRYNADFIKDSLKYLPEYEHAARMYSDRFIPVDTTNLSKEEVAQTIKESLVGVLGEITYEQSRDSAEPARNNRPRQSQCSSFYNGVEPR